MGSGRYRGQQLFRYGSASANAGRRYRHRKQDDETGVVDLNMAIYQRSDDVPNVPADASEHAVCRQPESVAMKWMILG